MAAAEDALTGPATETATPRPRRVGRPTKRALEAKMQSHQEDDTEHDSDTGPAGQDLKALLLLVLKNQQLAEDRHQREREMWKREIEAVRTEVGKLRKDFEGRLERELAKLNLEIGKRIDEKFEAFIQTASPNPSWAQVASQPSSRATPSSGLPTQPSVSPNSSASQRGEKQMASVILDLTRVSFDISDANSLKARANKAFNEEGTTKEIRCLGILRTPGEQKIKILLKNVEEADCLRTNDNWLHKYFPGARLQGEQWYPIKVDRVNKLSLSSDANSIISETKINEIGEENNVKINKVRWLSRPSDKQFGSVVVYLAKKEDAEMLLERQIMDFKGDSGFTRVYERRSVPTRCYRCHKYGHQEFRCPNEVVCGKCAESGHNEGSCTSANVKCISCKGPHRASDRGCKVYLDLLKRMNPVRDE
jgi:hypothetical protein